MRAEKRLRDGVKLVFGSEGWREGKFTTWSRVFHAVGIDWNIPESRSTVPQRKIDKLKSVLSETLKKSFLSKKRLDSVIGVLRHLISFVPVTKPFIQRLTAVQNHCRMLKKNGVPMTGVLRKDLKWWSVLAFQNELAGIPMDLFDQSAGFDDAWLVPADEGHISITSMKLLERLVIGQRDQSQREGTSAQALAEVTNTWGPSLTKVGAWRHANIHGERWVTDMIDKMNSKSSEGQDALRLCALSQARYRLHFTTQTLGRSLEQTQKCDVHEGTNYRNVQQIPSASDFWKRSENNSSEVQSQRAHSEATAEISSSGNRSATTSDSRCGSTNCPGQNRQGWLDCLRPCALLKGTTRQGRATSSRHLTAKW
ncbi:unnamed protein product [Phytophthora fragariaefolia]|uniref:Unnamed protein product n=1 Tax=Phytophthora fragariaefolia TaxID=1490495 RepID=A0A9W6U255_9STRA|nr:unnamed protein product [Phytophthora fragariaefolia]